MPPPHIGKPVTPREAAMISQWIKEGAQYRGHWAFEAVRRPAIPDVQNKAWPKNPVDSFVLARLEEEGILPSSQAQQETLARRVSLDLIGLPPTLADVDAFVNDRQEGATNGMSIDCWQANILVNAWRSNGSTLQGMPTVMVIKPTRVAAIGRGEIG